MIISFSYRKSDVFQDDILRPIAIYKGEDRNYQIFCEYLSEIDFDFTKNIIESIEKYDFSLDFSSESWGCEVINNYIKIFFLYDDENLDYTSVIPLDVFKKALIHWYNFLINSDNVIVDLKLL